MVNNMFSFILSLFGYAKVPLASLLLIREIKTEAEKKIPDNQKIHDIAEALEGLFRSGVKLNRRNK